MNALIEEWQATYSYFLANAEEAFFGNDDRGEFHWAALARQWKRAIEELESEIIKDLLKGEK